MHFSSEFNKEKDHLTGRNLVQAYMGDRALLLMAG